MEKAEHRNEELPSLTIEGATENDIDAYYDIQQSASGTSTYSWTDDREELLAYLRKNIVHLIRENSQVVGNVTYERDAPGHAHLHGLVIRPEFQGRGIARKVMQKVLEELKDVPIIDLATHPDNVRAIKLYESLGFTSGDRIENYYGDGEPRIVMTLKR